MESSTSEESVGLCKGGLSLVQAIAIADAVFNIPTREDLDGPIVTLPAPTTRLPRPQGKAASSG
ncbi:hypothetical protein C5167_027958 [Papaver somniferum]|nr:hypothetical protein C5167_027958 [Papaver somniferum]